MATISSFWIIKGFEVTGIYPFNRNIFTDVEYAPSFVNDRPNPSSTVGEETTGTNPSNQSSNTTGADEIGLCQLLPPVKMMATLRNQTQETKQKNGKS